MAFPFGQPPRVCVSLASNAVRRSFFPAPAGKDKEMDSNDQSSRLAKAFHDELLKKSQLRREREADVSKEAPRKANVEGYASKPETAAKPPPLNQAEAKRLVASIFGAATNQVGGSVPTANLVSKDPLAESIKQIESGAKEVRDAGEALSTRIKTFEDWLNKLPGRVSTQVKINFDGDSNHTYLRLDKYGKGWLLEVVQVIDELDQQESSVPLRDASLDLKILAVKYFPQLLERMVVSQKGLVASLQQTTAEFDAFAARIGMKGGA